MAGDEDMAHDPVHIPALIISRAHGHALRVMISDTRGAGLDVVMAAA
jgi:hypothetical protein